jgi:hypothetical protein
MNLGIAAADREPGVASQFPRLKDRGPIDTRKNSRHASESHL